MVKDTSSPPVSAFRPLSPENAENPYPFYRAMREQAPVYRVPELGFFIVSHYDDIMHVLHNEEIFSSNSPAGPGVGATPPTSELRAIMERGYPPVNTLLTNDPPAHTRFRALVNKAFTPRRVATLEPSVRAIANQLIDAFIDAGRVELVSQFAVGLPLTVIAGALGVPHSDMASFKRWSDDSVAPLGGMIGYERQLECARSIVEFQHYFAARLEERRSAPRDDLLTDLLNARLDGSEPLSMPEMLSILQQLLVAGNETTTNLIASAMMLLLDHPDQLAAVSADHSLMPNLIEEALRMESPVQGLFRVAKIDTEVGGVAIPAGSRLVVMYASGNRDEAEFAGADRFDIRRANARDHLAFGHGVHFCLGAALARVEGRIAFETLVTRLRNLRLDSDRAHLRHTPSFILRGLIALPLRFEAG